MENQHVMKSILVATVVLLLTIGGGAVVSADWSRSGSSDGSGSWSGGGSGSSSQPKCIASNMNLNLTNADCLKCHPGSTGANSANYSRHHNNQLFAKLPTTGPNAGCFACHPAVVGGSGTISFPVQTDCINCHVPTTTNPTGIAHGPSFHNNVTHCIVYDSCGSCHPGSIPDIHAGRSGSSSGSYSRNYSYHSGSYSTSSSNVSVCYLCHTSTNSTVKQTVAKGLAGQTVYCSNCHGGGR
jgi:hypothetical protein